MEFIAIVGHCKTTFHQSLVFMLLHKLNRAPSTIEIVIEEIATLFMIGIGLIVFIEKGIKESVPRGRIAKIMRILSLIYYVIVIIIWFTINISLVFPQMYYVRSFINNIFGWIAGGYIIGMIILYLIGSLMSQLRRSKPNQD